MIRGAISRLRVRLRVLIKRRVDQELREELDLHLDLLEEGERARGSAPAEARAAARRQFGNSSQIRETSRNLLVFRCFDALVRDTRSVGRFLTAHKGWTAIAVVSLTLGIGANAVVFSIVESVLLRPFPYSRPEEIVVFSGSRSIEEAHSGILLADLADIQERDTMFDSISWYGLTLRSPGPEPPVLVANCNSELFDVLGVRPLLGGVPQSNDPPVVPASFFVVLSYGFWQSRYGGDPSVVGTMLDLDRQPHEIVGVMPRGFFFPEPDVELWVVWSNELKPFDRTEPVFPAVARLRSGVGIGEAQAEIDVLTSALDQEFPTPTLTGMDEVDPGPRVVRLFPIREVAVRNSEMVLWLLLGAVGLVALVACANLANLLLTRGASREKELAVRATLGAARVVLIRQLLVESLAVSGLAGLLAIGLAYPSLRGLLTLDLVDIPRLESATIDLRVLLFTIAVSLAIGLAAGVMPAWRVSRVSLLASLQRAREGPAAGRTRLGHVLVVAEVAITLVLLIGAGLLSRSSAALAQVDWGFNPDEISVLALRNRSLEEEEPPEAVLDRLRRVPGVVAAGAGTTAPLVPSIVLGERVVATGSRLPSAVTAQRILVSPGYLEVLGVEVDGRVFDARDDRLAEKTVVLSRSLGRALFGDANALGQTVEFATLKSPQSSGFDYRDAVRVGGTAVLDDFELTGANVWRVVGIADDVRWTGELLSGTTNTDAVYVDYRQWAEPVSPDTARRIHSQNDFMSPMSLNTFLIRTTGNPAEVVERSKAAAAVSFPDAAFNEAAPMRTLVARALGGAGDKPLVLMLSLAFGALALVLAAAGIYGVISHTVSQRTYEIGVRMAVGAEPRNIQVMILQQGLRMTAIGLILGLAGSVAAARLLESQLFGISSTDATTFVFVTLFLLTTALVACWLPARRAARVDPLAATRAD